VGLDASHECWHGPYTGFQRWRQELARAAGYKVNERPNVLRGESHYELPWDRFEEKNYQGEWDSIPGDDPLMFLLVHSDCDGVIRPQHGVHLADRMEQLLPLLDESARPSVREETGRFIDGLRKAAAAGEDVEFG
jgi:hypothetical protein